VENLKISVGGEFLFSLIQTLFIALKLLNKIDWSWWWVLSPILITTSIGIIIFTILFFIMWRDR
jgi:hypothetical protein